MQYEIGQNIKIRHPKTFEVKNLTAIDGEHPVRNIIFICDDGEEFLEVEHGVCWLQDPDHLPTIWEILE